MNDVAAIIGGDAAPEGGNEFLSSLGELSSEPSLQTFKDVGGLAKSYVEAVKKIGVPPEEIIRAPKKDEDWAGVYNKLGRPESPDGYGEYEGIENDEAFAAYKQQMHELGLTKKQFDSLMRYNMRLAEDAQRGTEEAARQAAIERNENIKKVDSTLKKEWGEDYQRNTDSAKLALSVGGQQFLDLLKETGALHNAATWEALAKLGSKFREDTLINGEMFPEGVRSSKEAKAELERLRTDVDFQKKYVAGDSAAVRRITDLSKAAAAGV